jgi:hypothetical protein
MRELSHDNKLDLDLESQLDRLPVAESAPVRSGGEDRSLHGLPRQQQLLVAGCADGLRHGGLPPDDLAADE